MKNHLAVMIAVGLFCMPMCAVADPDTEIHAYALAFEVMQFAPPVDACPHEPGTSAVGVVWIARNVLFFGPGVGTSGVDGGDVVTIVCNGDTPQQIREKLTSNIREFAAGRGYDIKAVNVVVPTFQRGQ